VRDRDIVPRAAESVRRKPKTAKRFYEDEFTPDEIHAKEEKKRSFQGANVRVFLSTKWTFEFDLALAGLDVEMYSAVNIAQDESDNGAPLTEPEFADALVKYRAEYDATVSGIPDPTERAAKACSQIYTESISKPAISATLVRVISAADSESVRGKIPKYIEDAIIFATGG